MTTKNYEKPIKVLVCEKSIREINRAIDVLSALKIYCGMVKFEENNKTDENSKIFFDIHVVGALKRLCCKNGIVRMGNVGQFVNDLLENCDRITFPPDFFEDEKPDYQYHICEDDCCDEQYVPKISEEELKMIKEVAEIIHRLER